MDEAKWYKITFSAKLTEEDVHAMKNIFYDTMNECMNIHNIADLDIEYDENQNDLPN